MADERTAGGLPKSFFELIETHEKPVLVDFYADWCGPCRIVSPTVERIGREYSGRLLTVKINVDKKPEIAGRFQIHSIPTIMMFWKGAPLMRLQGAQPYDVIRRNVEANLTATTAERS